MRLALLLTLCSVVHAQQPDPFPGVEAEAEKSSSDFMDTTITFVAGDDNVLADAGETIPSSPRPDFRPRRGNSLFFDNYDSRSTGEETRTHLVLYKEFDGFFKGVTPEAAMVLEWDLNRSTRDNNRFEETGSRKVSSGIRDDGSYLATRFHFGDDSLQLLLFPVDSDRFRLGYSWELTWGGRASFLGRGLTPAIKLGWDSKRWYAYAGVKTGRRLQVGESDEAEGHNEDEVLYGALAGFGVDAMERLRIEANGGFFEKGSIPIDRDVRGERMNQLGGSLQITLWSPGIEPRRSLDTKVYRNAGARSLKPRRLNPRSGTAWLLSGEITYTTQTLEDSDALGASVSEGGFAGDINAVVETGAWRFNLDAVYRSLEFLVQDTPGLTPFGTLSETLDKSDEIFVAAGADWLLPGPRLVPGLALGVQLPAQTRTFTEDADGTRRENNLLVRKTKNVLGQTFIEPTALPGGAESTPIFSGRLALKSYLSDLMSLVLEGQVSWNENLVSNDPVRGIRTFDTPYVLGLGLIAQARF